MKKKGFTLVELLVVISIIALLMGILMPVLSKARKQAQNVICISHLHSWGLCFALYSQDWDDKVCQASTLNVVNGKPEFWAWDRTLKPYYTDDDIRFCATAKKIGSEPYLSHSRVGSKFRAWWIPHIAGDIMEKGEGVSGSYGMNGFAQYADPRLPTGPFSMSKEDHWGMLSIKKAQEIPLLGDCVWREAYPKLCDRPITDEDAKFDERDNCDYSNGQINRYLINRHNKAVNLVFLDGSVKHVFLPDLWNFRWSRTFGENDLFNTEVAIRWLK